jgi:hypothetical protein
VESLYSKEARAVKDSGKVVVVQFQFPQDLLFFGRFAHDPESRLVHVLAAFHFGF